MPSPTVSPTVQMMANETEACLNKNRPSGGRFRSDRGGSRTHDLRIKSPLLCQLSYPVQRGTKFGRTGPFHKPLHNENATPLGWHFR